MTGLELFLPTFDADPAMRWDEIEAELSWHLGLQRLLKGFLQTGQNLDYFEDFLAQEGLNPHEFWDAAAANLAVVEQIGGNGGLVVVH